MHGIRFGVFLSTLLALIVPWSALAQGFPPSPPRWSADWGYVNLGPGWNPSLTLDDQGVPVVSLTQGLVNPAENRWGSRPVVFWNDGGWKWGGGWSSQNVDVVQDHLIGSPTSIAMRSGQAQIAFSSRPYADSKGQITLKLARHLGGWNWSFETLDDTGTRSIIQVVQQSLLGSTWIAYNDPTQADHVRVKTHHGGSWHTSSFAMPHILVVPSLDLAVGTSPLGKPVLGIATTAVGTDRGLFFAASHDGGITWSPPVHVDDTWGMVGPQIAFSGDNPMIAYTELDSRVVKFAQSKDGGLTWNYEIVGAFDSAPGASIAVSPVTGEPVIAITGRDFAANETRLHIARRNEKGQWKIEIVDSMDLSLGYLFAVNPRIAIDHDDRVHVAYEIYNYADEAFVRYAWSNPEPPTTTPPGN